MAADRICSKLNRILASVRNTLVDDELRATYGELIKRGPESFNWIKVLRDENFDNFFTDFAGQGRIRWHYGVAHPLLCSFEDSFMAEDGRGWLPEDNADRARTFVRVSQSYFPFLVKHEECPARSFPNPSSRLSFSPPRRWAILTAILSSRCVTTETRTIA